MAGPAPTGWSVRYRATLTAGTCRTPPTPTPSWANMEAHAGVNGTGRRGFGQDGRWARDIDFTDHGRPPEHPNPHQHRIDLDTGRRGPAEPLD